MKNEDLAYKAFRFNHADNTITLIGEYEYTPLGRETAEEECYLSKCDETADDKNNMFTWDVVVTYKFNTKLDGE